MPSSGSGEAEEEALRSSALRQVGSETGLREMALKKLGAGKEGGVTVKLEEESNDYCEKPDAPKELQKGDKVWYRNSDGTYARVEVVRIDYSVQPESFEILINGGHRETNRNRLLAEDPRAPAPTRTRSPERRRSEEGGGRHTAKRQRSRSGERGGRRSRSPRRSPARRGGGRSRSRSREGRTGPPQERKGPSQDRRRSSPQDRKGPSRDGRRSPERQGRTGPPQDRKDPPQDRKDQDRRRSSPERKSGHGQDGRRSPVEVKQERGRSSERGGEKKRRHDSSSSSSGSSDSSGSDSERRRKKQKEDQKKEKKDKKKAKKEAKKMKKDKKKQKKGSKGASSEGAPSSTFDDRLQSLASLYEKETSPPPAAPGKDGDGTPEPVDRIPGDRGGGFMPWHHIRTKRDPNAPLDTHNSSTGNQMPKGMLSILPANSNASKDNRIPGQTPSHATPISTEFDTPAADFVEKAKEKAKELEADKGMSTNGKEQATGWKSEWMAACGGGGAIGGAFGDGPASKVQRKAMADAAAVEVPKCAQHVGAAMTLDQWRAMTKSRPELGQVSGGLHAGNEERIQGKKKEGGEAVPDVAKGDWVCMSKRCTEVINFRKDTKCSKCGAVKRMNQASYKAPKDEAPVKAHKFIFL